jgi:septal ring factor EnvC (AmiA/AmiB activator)
LESRLEHERLAPPRAPIGPKQYDGKRSDLAKARNRLKDKLDPAQRKEIETQIDEIESEIRSIELSIKFFDDLASNKAPLADIKLELVESLD